MYSSNFLKGRLAKINSSYNMPEFDSSECELIETLEEVYEGHLSSTNFQSTDQYDMVDNTQEEALRIIEAAKLKAEAILAEANKNADKLYAETYQSAKQKGYQEGFEQGETEAQANVQGIIADLQTISNDLATQKQEFLSTSKKIILDLASEIAQKVVGESFTVENGALYAMFKRVIKKIPAAEKLIITVSETDYQIKTFNAEKLCELAVGFHSVELHRDTNAPSGTLKIETPLMLIDAGINTQIGLLKRDVV